MKEGNIYWNTNVSDLPLDSPKSVGQNRLVIACKSRFYDGAQQELAAPSASFALVTPQKRTKSTDSKMIPGLYAPQGEVLSRLAPRPRRGLVFYGVPAGDMFAARFG